MKYAFFHIDVIADDDATERFNRFLNSHRVLQIDKRFVESDQHTGWAFCVSYDTGSETSRLETRRSKVDYREQLSEQDFRLFARLRELRKRVAQEHGLPVYSVLKKLRLTEMTVPSNRWLIGD